MCSVKTCDALGKQLNHEGQDADGVGPGGADHRGLVFCTAREGKDVLKCVCHQMTRLNDLKCLKCEE